MTIEAVLALLPLKGWLSQSSCCPAAIVIFFHIKRQPKNAIAKNATTAIREKIMIAIPPSKKNVTIINIGGTSRSGTTMLHLMMGNAEDAFACGEVGNWYRPRYQHNFQITCPCGCDPCPLWEQLRDLPADEFHIEACRKLNVRYIVDSSKTLSWLFDVQRWVGFKGPDVVNLVIWKDPVELAHSFWKRGYEKNHWRSEFIKYYGRILRCGMPVSCVNYGELVRRPDLKLAELCRVAGMEYFEGKERFWEKTNHHIFGSPSVREQAETKQSDIQPAKLSLEFSEEAKQVKRVVARDRKLIKVLDFLRQNDVSNAGCSLKPTNFVPHHPLPPWYYWQRAKAWKARRFPRPFPMNRLNEEAR